MPNASLSIVLPIHNAETSLRQSIGRVLEVASDLTPSFEVLIYDDGSTDDSFDIASELAARYPQIQVARQARHRGLGPTLKSARRRATGEVVIVHDGVSTLKAEQLRSLWSQRLTGVGANEVSIADLHLPARTHAAMASVHQRLMGFQMLKGNTEAKEAAHQPVPAPKRKSAGIGSIPVLPRPNFLNTLGDFALGE